MSARGGASVARVETEPGTTDGAGLARHATRWSRPCPVCGSLSGRPHHGPQSALRRCPCGLVLVDPLPGEEEIADLEREAFGGGLRDETAEMFAAYGRDFPDDPVVRGFRAALAWLRDRTGGGRLLDVGIGSGLLLHLAAEAGFQPLGVEISPAAAERARSEFGVDVWVGDFERFPADQPIDALVMADVLEHTADPRRFLEHAARVLRPGGALFVAVPNRRSTVFFAADLLARVPPLAEVARRLYVPNHYTYFTPATLVRLVREIGFEVAQVQVASPYLDRYRLARPVKLGLSTLIAIGRWTGLEARVELCAVRR